MTVNVTVSVCECDLSVSLLTRIVGMEYLSFNIKLLQFSWGCTCGWRLRMTHVYMYRTYMYTVHVTVVWFTLREKERQTDRQTDRQTAVLEFRFLKSTNQENKLKFSTDSRLSGIHTEIFKTVTIQGPTPSPTATVLVSYNNSLTRFSFHF